MAQKKNRELKRSEMAKSRRVKQIKKYSLIGTVLLVAAAACGGLFYAWIGTDTSEKWHIPFKKAEFSEQDKEAGIKEAVDKIQEYAGRLGKANKHTGVAQAASPEQGELQDPAEPYLRQAAVYLERGDIDAGVKNLEVAAKLNPAVEPLLIEAKRLQSEIRMMPGVNIHQKDIHRVMRGMRAEDVERYARRFGMGRTPEEREMLREAIRQMKKMQEEN